MLYDRGESMPPAIPEAGSELSQNEALGEQLIKLTRELLMQKTYIISSDLGCIVDDNRLALMQLHE